MIQHNTVNPDLVSLQSSEPLSVVSLAFVADEIAESLRQYRPEFANLIRLHRRAGCRVKELFTPHRWETVSNVQLSVQPQKGNAKRQLRFVDIGFADANAFAIVLTDMARLPRRQYERAFADVVQEKGLWRLYDEGFAHPSTHLFRHVRIKELAAEGQEKSYIATWIGEKNEQNLDYYLNSRFFL